MCEISPHLFDADEPFVLPGKLCLAAKVRRMRRYRSWCVFAWMVVMTLLIGHIRPHVEQHAPRPLSNRTVISSPAITACSQHRYQQLTKVSGPENILMVMGQRGQHDRINLLLFNSACHSIRVLTASPPTNEFVDSAARVCSSIRSSRNVTTQHLRITGSHLLYVVYAASSLPGQSLELLLDSIGSLLVELTVPPLRYERVTVLVDDYAHAGLVFAASYVQMLREAISKARLTNVRLEFEISTLSTPHVLELGTGSEFMFTSPVARATPCQILAQELLWRPLIASMEPPRLLTCEQCIILKMNISLTHHTPMFFSLSENSNGSMVLREDISKYHRMWLLNHARAIVDSAGANSDINRLLLVPKTSSSNFVCWLTFVHPDSHLVSFCRFGASEPVPGYRRRYCCPSTPRLETAAISNNLKTCSC